ncbi:MAG: biosynthetic-type acetolactate synthase large subunit [Chloroflexi bacterium]|nr:biosynthetic-type acetolactate synthase large subunit [Chloroflexota bacterium]
MAQTSRLPVQSLFAGASGARVLCAALCAHGVDVIFGYPGGAQIPFNQELADWQDLLRHVLVRHEQNAAHAADGYARATGRVGVCTSTSGPGATNLVTGLATAWMDGAPILALTGQVNTAAIGTMAFQEVDIVSIARPVTKAVFQPRRPDEILPTVRQAFEIALSGRPGPVLIDLPKDVLLGSVGADANLDAVEPPASVIARPEPAADSVQRVAELLQQARRPVLLVGQGVAWAGASDLVRRLAERLDLPVASTLLGMGALPSDHPLSLGMPGMHGTLQATIALQQSDLIIGLGARFDDRVVGRAKDFAPEATIVHVDLDRAAFGRVARCDVPVLADVGLFLEALLRETAAGDHAAWRAQLDDWSRTHGGCGDGPPGELSSPLVLRMLRELSGDDAIVFADVGQHQMFAGLYWRHTRPRQFFTSGGLGTMGYATPAAMGAQLALPGRVVWALVGDGGFQMSAPELQTLVSERIPVKIAVFNNRGLGMVRQWQELFMGRNLFNSQLPQPDFVALAGAHGCLARRVETVAELQPAVEAALEHDGPVLLDLRVLTDELVFPMVPPGAGNGDVICVEGRVL